MTHQGRVDRLERLLYRASRRLHKLSKLDERIRTAEATAKFPKGTAVSLDGCGCRSTYGDHEGIWYVDRYDVEANDYRLTRSPDGFTSPTNTGTTYAVAGSMRKVP